MTTVRSGGDVRHSGLLVLAFGFVLSALGVGVAVWMLPPGIMFVLLGTVLIVLGALQDMPE